MYAENIGKFFLIFYIFINVRFQQNFKWISLVILKLLF